MVSYINELLFSPEGSSPDESFLSLLRSANKTGRFWVGASDFEERGKFKWYYSGKSVSESNWFENGGRPKAPATKEDDDRCLQVCISIWLQNLDRDQMC